MNYGELRTYFLNLLNRNDCADTLADTFITFALRRTERLLRVPLQTNTLNLTLDNTWTGSFALPVDFLGVSELTVNGSPLSRLTTAQGNDQWGYEVNGSMVEVHYPATEGAELSFVYYAQFPVGVADTDTTIYSEFLPDLTVYGALVFAADYFLMDQKPLWESTYVSLLTEIQTAADIEASWGSMAISPMGGGVA